MTRAMTPAVAAAIAAAEVFPALFLEGEFASGTVRLSTLYSDIDWNGETWTGAGNLVEIGEVVEGETVQAESLVVTFSGVPPELVQLAIEEARQNMPGSAWIAFLTSDGTIIPDPIPLAEARLDVPQIVDGDETATIVVSYEGFLVDLLRPRNVLYTDQAQQQLYPGDRGLEYIAAIQNREIAWGRPGPSLDHWAGRLQDWFAGQ